MTLYGGSTLIATTTIPGATIDATMGAFTTYSTALTLPSSTLVGQQLRVYFAISYGDGSSEFALDNVRISTAVPEPSSLALLAAGLVGLLCCAWRKRK